jgi:hypothetical protein
MEVYAGTHLHSAEVMLRSHTYITIQMMTLPSLRQVRSSSKRPRAAVPPKMLAIDAARDDLSQGLVKTTVRKRREREFINYTS